MGNILVVAGGLGGLVGGIVGLGFFAILPDICTPAGVFGLNYDCFGLGEADRKTWALGLGGIVGLVVIVGTYLTKGNSSS